MHRRALSKDQQLERAKQAIAEWAARKLTVPKIYFDVGWQDRDRQADVLAIDRAGAGDVHVFQIKNTPGAAMRTLHRMFDVEAHFRWLVALTDNGYVLNDTVRLYPASGSGKIGLINLTETAEGTLLVRVASPAERARVSEHVYERADEVVSSRASQVRFR